MDIVDRLENKALSNHLQRYQAKLLPFAYNIIGDFMEAEDIVQEVLNHHFLTAPQHIDNPDHYLVRSVINRAINQKNLLRNRMEQYPGKWLPTPVFTEESIYTDIDKSCILNYSLLVLLEHLNPIERAVFILKETFDFSHIEIGDLLDINPENSRQLLKRSKEKIRKDNTESVALTAASRSLLHQLTEAILAVDIEKATKLLMSDVQCTSDGGSHVSAAKKVIIGQERVYKFLKAIYGKYLPNFAVTHFTTINHQPSILFRLHGKVFRCIVFEMKNEVIQKVFVIVNPEKLQRLNF